MGSAAPMKSGGDAFLGIRDQKQIACSMEKSDAINACEPDPMKHLIVKLSLACLVWLLLAGQTVEAVSLRVGVVRGFPGNFVEVPVSLSYHSNEVRDVVALQADVLFDAGGIGDAAPSGAPLLSRHTLASSGISSGVRRLLVYSTENAVLTNGEVARIPFTVAPNQFRNFPLTLTNVILVRADATPVPATNRNGAIAVNQVFVAADGHADGFLNVATNGLDQCYVIQATTNFVTWVNVQTNNTESGLLDFVDPEAGEYSHRFYRAIVCDKASGLHIGIITQLANGRVQFDFTGGSGHTYVIQGSTNLTDWENIRTNVGVNGPITFTDSFANFSRRFYRVRAVE